jgi:hypothetical protein
MKILVLSDLHLSHSHYSAVQHGARVDAQADVVVLAGDIDDGWVGFVGLVKPSRTNRSSWWRATMSFLAVTGRATLMPCVRLPTLTVFTFWKTRVLSWLGYGFWAAVCGATLGCLGLRGRPRP